MLKICILYFRSSQRENLAAGRLSIRLKLEDSSLHPPSLPSVYLVPSNTFTLNPFMTKSLWWDLNCLSSPFLHESTISHQIVNNNRKCGVTLHVLKKRKPPETMLLSTKSHIQAKYEWTTRVMCIPKVLLSSSQVLELLCQILQTDSLTAVQQWLLLAGQRGNIPPGCLMWWPATRPACVSVTGCSGSSVFKNNLWQLTKESLVCFHL